MSQSMKTLRISTFFVVGMSDGVRPSPRLFHLYPKRHAKLIESKIPDMEVICNKIEERLVEKHQSVSMSDSPDLGKTTNKLNVYKYLHLYCVIEKVESDGTVFVQFDDGDIWSTAPAHEIRPSSYPELRWLSDEIKHPTIPYKLRADTIRAIIFMIDNDVVDGVLKNALKLLLELGPSHAQTCKSLSYFFNPKALIDDLDVRKMMEKTTGDDGKRITTQGQHATGDSIAVFSWMIQVGCQNYIAKPTPILFQNLEVRWIRAITSLRYRAKIVAFPSRAQSSALLPTLSLNPISAPSKRSLAYPSDNDFSIKLWSPFTRLAFRQFCNQKIREWDVSNLKANLKLNVSPVIIRRQFYWLGWKGPTNIPLILATSKKSPNVTNSKKRENDTDLDHSKCVVNHLHPLQHCQTGPLASWTQLHNSRTKLANNRVLSMQTSKMRCVMQASSTKIYQFRWYCLAQIKECDDFAQHGSMTSCSTMVEKGRNESITSHFALPSRYQIRIRESDPNLKSQQKPPCASIMSMLLSSLVFALSSHQSVTALWRSHHQVSSIAILDRQPQTESVYSLKLLFGASYLRGNITVNDGVNNEAFRAVNDFAFTCNFQQGPVTLSKSSGAKFEWSCGTDTTSCFQEEDGGLVITPASAADLRISHPSGSSIIWTLKRGGESSVSCDSGENVATEAVVVEEEGQEEDDDSEMLMTTFPRKKFTWKWKYWSKKKRHREEDKVKKSGKEKLKKIAKKIKEGIKKKIWKIEKYHGKRKKKHSEQKGDPMITDFSGNTYFVSSPGAYLNVGLGKGEQSIQSCFYNSVNGHHYTRAVGFKCGSTVMIAHLSHETMDNWRVNETVKSFNVYYLDASSSHFLGDTGDFGDACTSPGKHNHEVSCSCPRFNGKNALALEVIPTRTSWHPASTHYAPTLNIAIDMDDNDGSDSVISGLTQAGQQGNMFYKSGPNTNGAVCEENKLRTDDPKLRSSPCGPTTWRLEKNDDLFSLATGHTKDGYFVLSCDK
eukprot:jgi/Bigna1/76668/fgenesh1_pg.42_\